MVVTHLEMSILTDQYTMQFQCIIIRRVYGALQVTILIRVGNSIKPNNLYLFASQ